MFIYNKKIVRMKVWYKGCVFEISVKLELVQKTNVFLSEPYTVYKVFERSLAKAYIERSLVYADILICLLTKDQSK